MNFLLQNLAYQYMTSEQKRTVEQTMNEKEKKVERASITGRFQPLAS